MSVAQRITEAEYEQIVWADPDHKWELVDGRLREKPGMSWEHGETLMSPRLSPPSSTRPSPIHRSRRKPCPAAAGNICIPDLFVAPIAYGEEFRDRPGVLAIISQPLPLVVEVWSRSTGDYDVEAKIPVYQQRGDLEIWRIHPYERTLTAWRRQPDGSYVETVYRREPSSRRCCPASSSTSPNCSTTDVSSRGG